MTLHLRDGFEQMKFSRTQSCELSAHCSSYRKVLWTMSIHAFLTGDEWFIWLVKGRREQRMPIKLEKHLFRMMASWEEAGSSSTLLPFFLFHIVVHKRAATASNASLKLKRVTWLERMNDQWMLISFSPWLHMNGHHCFLPALIYSGGQS